MVRALKENWALFAGMLMLMMANGLLSTLLSVRGAEIGFSGAVIGMMQACYPLGALLGCVVAPQLVERVGHVRAFGALASVCSVCAVVHLVTNDAASWSVMRLLAGFCFPGLYVVSESWLNAKSNNKLRASILSVYFVVQIAGAAIGQALTAIKDPEGTLLFVVTSILISLSLVPLLVSTNPPPTYVAPERLPLRVLVKISPTAIFGAILTGAAQAAFYVAMPLYGLALGMSVGEAASLLVVGTVSGALVQFPVGWLSDQMDRRLVILCLSLATVAVVGLKLGGVIDSNYVVVALLCASLLPVYSLCIAHANDQLEPSQIVPASGTLGLVVNSGIFVGAFGGPVLLSKFGPEGYLACFAVIGLLTAAVTTMRRVQVDAPSETGTAHAVSAQGMQVVGVLHPEAAESQDSPKSK